MPQRRSIEIRIFGGAILFAWIALICLLRFGASTAAAPSEVVDAAPLFAPNIITGTVIWKDSDQTPANGVRVTASDNTQKQEVAEAMTDQSGNYMLLLGVGTWLVEVPSNDQYFGYGQIVNVLPHETYKLDFGITKRDPTPTPGPTETAKPTQTPDAAATATIKAWLATGGQGTPPPGATPQANGTKTTATSQPNASGTPVSGGSTLPHTGTNSAISIVTLPNILWALALLMGLLGYYLVVRASAPLPVASEKDSH